MSRLLIPGRTLQVLPKLAEAIGLNEAIALQQIHYWLVENKENERQKSHFRDGRWWTYNTAAGWKKNNFPFWSESTIRRTFKALREMGLVLTGNYNRAGYDKTLWYTIDYEALTKLEVDVVKMNTSSIQNDNMEMPNMGTPIPESTESTTESTTKHADKSASEVHHEPENCPTCDNLDRSEQWEKVVNTCPDCQKPISTGEGLKVKDLCTCRGEAALDAAGFGKQERREDTTPADRPWLEKSGGQFKPRHGVSVEVQERVLWLIEGATRLFPLDGEWKAWSAGCVAVYQAASRAEKPWRMIEQGILTAWNRDLQYRPAHCKGTDNGFVKAVRKLAAASTGKGNRGSQLQSGNGQERTQEHGQSGQHARKISPAIEDRLYRRG